MPLTWATITRPSRIMLPAYIVSAFAVAAVYIFDPGDRLANAPALRFQAEVLPWPAWGAVMVVMGVAMTAAWARWHQRYAFCFVLAMYAVTWLVWGVTWAIGIFVEGATPLGPILAAFVATAAIASIASVVGGDRS